jgi:hypothetical protein
VRTAIHRFVGHGVQEVLETLIRKTPIRLDLVLAG